MREYVDSHENLLILCQYHHDLVDGDANEFSPEELRRWKVTHQAGISSHDFLRNFQSPQWMAPRLVLPHVRRGPLLDKLMAALEGAHLAVVGMAGAGKTQLVAEFFEEAGGEYTQRLWLKGETRAQIETELASLGLEGDGETHPADVSAEASRAIRALDRVPGYLLVIDGVRDFGEVRDFDFRNGRIVVISQSRAWPGFAVLPVTGLAEAEAFELLSRYMPMSDAEEADRETLEAIVAECGANPLLISQAGHYMSSRAVSPRRYIHMLRAERVEVLERGGVASEATFHSSLALAARELSPEGLELAQILSFVSDSAISIDPIPELEGDQRGDLLSSQLRLEDAVSNLLRFSLVEREGERVRMHSIVQGFFRHFMDSSSRGIAFAHASVLVHSQTPRHRSNAEQRRLFADAIPHIEALLAGGAEFSGLADLVLPPIANRLGSYYVETARHERGQEILRVAAEMAMRAGDPSTLASLRHNLANSALERGDLESALAGAREALAMKEEIRREEGGNESFVAYTHVLLGDILGHMEDFDGCISHNEIAAKLHQEGGHPGLAAGALLTVAQVQADDPDMHGRAVETLKRCQDLLDDDRSASFIDEMIRLAMVTASLNFRLERYALAARAAKAAEDLVLADRPNSLDLPRALILRAGSIGPLGQGRSRFVLLQQAEERLNAVADAQPVDVEKVRGNIGYTYMQGLCGRCAVRLTTESENALRGLLPDGHPTRLTAERMAEEALQMSAALEGTSLSACPGPH